MTDKTTKTHYRTFSNSEHFASDDLLGIDRITLTVKKAYKGFDLNEKKKGEVALLEFVEENIKENHKLKTMILNMTNLKAMEDITGSPYLEDWHGARIEVYVQEGIKRGGELVNGLRIRQAPALPKLSDERLNGALIKIQNNEYTSEQLLARFTLTDAQIERLNEALRLNEASNGTE